MKTHSALAAFLAFAVLTLWVSGRWAIGGVEVCAYLGACAVVIVQRGRVRMGAALLAPVLMCVWAVIQWTAHWSIVPSATVDSGLYWLAAACFVFIGSQVDRDAFLKTALAIGAVVCVAGTVQLFTSPGNIFWLFPSGFDRRVIGPFVSPNNYAAFVELLIPVALALSAGHGRKPIRSAADPRVCGLVRDRPIVSQSRAPSGGPSTVWPYLLIASALAATVVASGSRTGAALVLSEIVTILVVQRWNRRALLVFLPLTTVFSLIAGQQFLTSRFAQRGDPFAVRREFLQSSLAMFRAQPVHGFGLGTWPSAYPQFAIVDTGETANHAHNEWAQWAAEGGAPALIFMLGLLLWTVRPAIRSIWGIGILAVFAHSLVDYPFLRLGLAVWVFAFLGALSAGGRRRGSLPDPEQTQFQGRGRGWLLGAIAPVLLIGTWQAGKIACADVLYRRATTASVERAAALTPDRADYQFVLAQLDSPHAVAHLERALAANAYDTRARIGLALEREAAGDRTSAARQLLQAARYDHQFAPAWALANFYFRSGETDRFWTWARKSGAMSYGSRRALFDLCFLESGDSREIFAKVVRPRRDMEPPFLEYLIARHRIRDAAEVAERIARDPALVPRRPLRVEDGDPPDGHLPRYAVLDYIDAGIGAGETAAAWRVQSQLTGEQRLLLNGDFAGPLRNRGFDWKMAVVDGIGVARTQDGGPALSIEFSGREPESCELLRHSLALESGVAYIMAFDYRTVDLSGPTGVSWSLGAAHGIALDASEAWKRQEWRFRAADAAELQLAYQRTPGNTRAEGQLFLRNARIDAAHL